MKKISKDMIIAAILKEAPEAAEILLASGMHCLGCPASQGESLEQACAVHGLDCEKVVNAVNEYLATLK